MTYSLFDFNGNLVNNTDLQDKGAWCKHGFLKEFVFITKYGSQFGLEINPSKSNNPYLPDLKYVGHSKLADLKTQNTPFFSCGKYGLDPQFTVTFNRKDRDRYLYQYPDIDIYFWIDWQVGSFKNDYSQINVKPMRGISRIHFQALHSLCNHAPLHTYSQRIDDAAGNAKDSYLIDLNSNYFQHFNYE